MKLRIKLKNKWLTGGLLAFTLATPPAFCNVIESWSGSAQGNAGFWNAGNRTCSYGSGYSTTSCVAQTSGSVPTTYNTYTALGILPYPDFAGDLTSSIVNVSSYADSAGLHASVYAEVDGNIYIPNFMGLQEDGSASGTAAAEQQDSFTPVPPSGWNGGTYYMSFTFNVDGEFVQTVTNNGILNPNVAYAYGQLEFEISPGLNADSQYITIPSGLNGVGDNPVVTTVSTGLMPVSTGASPIDYAFTLTAYAATTCITPILGVCNATSSAQFSDTATLAGITFEDANGNPIPGFSIDSSSSIDYNSMITSNLTDAPEPGTAWLLAGTVALAAILRKGASQRV